MSTRLMGSRMGNAMQRVVVAAVVWGLPLLGCDAMQTTQTKLTIRATLKDGKTKEVARMKPPHLYTGVSFSIVLGQNGHAKDTVANACGPDNASLRLAQAGDHMDVNCDAVRAEVAHQRKMEELEAQKEIAAASAKACPGTKSAGGSVLKTVAGAAAGAIVGGVAVEAGKAAVRALGE